MNAMPCVLCQKNPPSATIIGVGRLSSADQMSEWPVCDECHRDPAHRTFPMKLHFHFRVLSTLAVGVSNILDAKSRRGEDISL